MLNENNPFTNYLNKWGTPGWEVNYTGGFATYQNNNGKGRILIVEEGFKCQVTPLKGRKPADKIFKQLNAAVNHVMGKLDPIR